MLRCVHSGPTGIDLGLSTTMMLQIAYLARAPLEVQVPSISKDQLDPQEPSSAGEMVLLNIPSKRLYSDGMRKAASSTSFGDAVVESC